MIRITVTLNNPEAAALFKLAQREMRHPRDQAAYIIKQALIAMDALPNLPEKETNEVAGARNTPRG